MNKPDNEDSAVVQGSVAVTPPSASLGMSTGRPTVTITASASAALAAATQTQATEIQRLGPIFEKMTDQELFVILNDEREIGPQIGINDVPESTVRACGAYEATVRESRRTTEEARNSGKREGIRLGALYAGPGVALLALLAKLLGWI